MRRNPPARKPPPERPALSRNGTRHGLCATNFITDVESFENYCAHRDTYMARYGPRDQVEADLVERIAQASWNINRCSGMEHELMNAQMVRMKGSVDREWEGLSPDARMAFAMEELAKEPAFALILRYKVRSAGDYDRARKSLRELRKDFPNVPPGAPVPEPEEAGDTDFRPNPFPNSDTIADPSGTGPCPAAASQVAPIGSLQPGHASPPADILDSRRTCADSRRTCGPAEFPCDTVILRDNRSA